MERELRDSTHLAGRWSLVYHPCTIYEASHRIGGSMHSDAMTWADGMVSEWCGEFIDADHETMHQLIKRFGETHGDHARLWAIWQAGKSWQACVFPGLLPGCHLRSLPTKPSKRS
ncbi:MAG: hypothetical protein ACJ8AG_12850 [Ktedonobacteraceae bacterium]